jgi:spoIIIJ-associated protein
MNLNTITALIEKILEPMHLKVEVTQVDDTDLHLPIINIKAEDPNILIGYKGETLMALSHILKKIADKEKGEDIEKLSFIVDVNGYQKRRIDEIKDKSRILVERAKYYKSSVEMEPMSPYERMIVHSLFSEEKNITTSSTGFGKERKVVITYNGE